MEMEMDDITFGYFSGIYVQPSVFIWTDHILL